MNIQTFQQALVVAREPDKIFTHHFLGFGIHKSDVLVEIYYSGQQAIVLFTDTGKGTSITNACEQVITEVYNKYLRFLCFHPKNCLFAETYDKYKEGIDMIVPEWKQIGSEWICEDVEWRHLGKIIDNAKNKKK